MKKHVHIILLFTAISCVSTQDEVRSKLLLIDSGVNLDKSIEPFLCKQGHKSFLVGEHNNPLVDSTGHGTVMLKAIASKLDPKKHCVVIYKTYPGYPAPEPYAKALLEAQRWKFDSVAIALEDVSYYFEEPNWLKELAEVSRVFVSAGNAGKDLSKICDVYPACLSKEIDSENFRVVGSRQKGMNEGGPINEIEEGEITVNNESWKGTSFSTARAAASFVRSKQEGIFPPAK